MSTVGGKMPELTSITEARKSNRVSAQLAVPSRAAGAIELGDLRVDPVARKATHRGDPVMLSPMEFNLLVFLARNPGRVFVWHELLDNVWGLDHAGNKHTVVVSIGWLRTKLGDPGRLIQTVAGGGYRLAVPRTVRS